MEDTKEFKYLACSLPRCKCSSLEVKLEEDGEYYGNILDDFGGHVKIPVGELAMISSEFLKKWDSGIYWSSDDSEGEYAGI